MNEQRGEIMDFITKEEFINESNIEIIQKLMERNNGYITTKDLENFDISRNYLSIMAKKNMIEKVAKGLYIDSTKIEDVYYVLSVSTPKIIYSHMTALYFHNLSIKAPNSSFDITVTKKYNNPKLKNHNVFYVDDEFYNLGITEVMTPQGNMVKAYDVERCICDIIRSKKRMDSEHVKYSIKEYIKWKDKDLIKLSNYAEKMGIRNEVMNYMEIFYE
jgi:predicted transcriptional regulator of viral defense system